MKTCKRGHPWEPENIYVSLRGQRSCRLCKSARGKELYEANREHIRAQQQTYVERNRDALREANRAYRAANRERLLAKKKADYQANREHYLAITRRWAENNPERHRYLQRRSHLKCVYGMTPEDYDSMLKVQNGRCAICREVSAYRLHVDHDHTCCPGKGSCGRCIRGLLCGPCNRLLGWYETKSEAFEAYVAQGRNARV